MRIYFNLILSRPLSLLRVLERLEEMVEYCSLCHGTYHSEYNFIQKLRTEKGLRTKGML